MSSAKTEGTAPPVKPSPRVPPHRSSFLSWVPTDEKQLYDCEAVLLSSLYKIGFTQYHCSGLNTVSLKAVYARNDNNNKQQQAQKQAAAKNDDKDSATSVDPIFDLSHLKESQTKNFCERWERKNSFFGGSSSSNTNSQNNKSSGRCMPIVRTNPIAMKEEGLAQFAPFSSSSSSSSSSSTIPESVLEIKIILNHIVFVHGFAGGIVNWLPNLKAAGDLVNKKNLANLQKAVDKAERQHFTNENNNNNNNKLESSNPVHLTILHAFDLPGFARSKRDENISFDNPEGVIRYMTWSFNEWFKENEISATNSNVEKWIRRYDCHENEEKESQQHEQPAAKNVKIKFVSAVENTKDRKPEKCHQITINGHSFGAFLSSHYCANFPSPFAISKDFVYNPSPNLSITTREDESSDTTSNEKQKSSNAQTKISSAPPLFQEKKIGCGVTHLILTDPFGVPIFDEKNPAHTTENFDWKWRLAANVLLGTMESALTPALRALGPFAPNFINNMRPDFLERWEGLVEDPKMIMDYIFHCNAQKANLGDHSMAKTVIKGSRAFAHIPLLPVVPDLAKIDANVKLSLVYGSQTWMDKTLGVKMFDERRDQLKIFFGGNNNNNNNNNVNGEQQNQKQANHHNFWHGMVGLCETIAGAGHQVNTDQPDLYNDFLFRVCDLKQ